MTYMSCQVMSYEGELVGGRDIDFVTDKKNLEGVARF
jgi:hypothetical protein